MLFIQDVSYKDYKFSLKPLKIARKFFLPFLWFVEAFQMTDEYPRQYLKKMEFI